MLKSTCVSCVGAGVVNSMQTVRAPTKQGVSICDHLAAGHNVAKVQHCPPFLVNILIVAQLFHLTVFVV